MNLTTQQELALYAKWKEEHRDDGYTDPEWYVRNYVETRLMPALASASDPNEQMHQLHEEIEHPNGEGTWSERFDKLGGEDLCVYPPDEQILPVNHLFRGDIKGEMWPENKYELDPDKIKAFLATELSHQAKGIVEMAERMKRISNSRQVDSLGAKYAVPKVSVEDKNYNQALTDLIIKIRNNYIND